MKKIILTSALICTTLLSTVSLSTTVNAENIEGIKTKSRISTLLKDSTPKFTGVSLDEEENLVFNFAKGTDFIGNTFVLSTSETELVTLTTSDSDRLVLSADKVKDIDWTTTSYYIHYINYNGETNYKFVLLTDVTLDIRNKLTEGTAIAPPILAPDTIEVTDIPGYAAYFLTGKTTPNTSILLRSTGSNTILGTGFTDCNGEFITVIHNGDQATADAFTAITIDVYGESSQDENGVINYVNKLVSKNIVR